MLLRQCLRLILDDIWTVSCLHHFLLEFIGTALFLCISLSSTLIFPPTDERLGLDPRFKGNQTNLCNLSKKVTLSNLCNLDNLSNQNFLCNLNSKVTQNNLCILSNICNLPDTINLSNHITQSNLSEQVFLCNLSELCNQTNLCNMSKKVTIHILCILSNLCNPTDKVNLGNQTELCNQSNKFILINLCNPTNLCNLSDEVTLSSLCNLCNHSNLCSLSGIIMSNLCNKTNFNNLSNLRIPRDQVTFRYLNNQSNHCNLTPEPVSSPSHLQVALVFGLSVAMAALCVGGEVHLNPMVTLAMALTLRLRLWRAALYVIGQLLGGVVSAALLLGLTGDVTPALNQVTPGVHVHQAVTVETLATLQLILIVLATVDANLPATVSNLLVGLAVTLGHLVAISVTGCGMNPARSFGPAVVTLDFNNHWVFWVGPGLGAGLAVLLNDLLFRPRWHHPKDWWMELKKLYASKDKQQQVALSHSP